MKVVFLTRYADRGASSRVRATQFRRALAKHGIDASFWPLLSDRYLELLYAGRRSIKEMLACYLARLRRMSEKTAADLIWIEKELLPYVPYAWEASLLKGSRYVIDLDDAVFHTYDRSKSGIVRWLLGNKIDRLMAGAALVTAGNSYLAERAVEAGSRHVEMIPSVIDLASYPAPSLAKAQAKSAESLLRVVWIGSPATVRYLDLVRTPFEQVARERAVELRIVGASAPKWRGVATVSVPWTLESECQSIATADVGIMPLLDTPWERGKCGYKLIQYMACALPVIASPVGVNSTIVMAGFDGFLAATEEQWSESLLKLASDPALRELMGARGRSKVEAQYSVQAVVPRLASLLKEAVR